MSIVSKLQPVFIILSAFLGVLLGKASVVIEEHAGGFTVFFLVGMLFFVFLGVDIGGKPGRFFRANIRFSVAAFVINFLWTPLFAFFLAKALLPGQFGLQIGFVMLLVTPCTDWYLVFTGLANGSVALGSSILPLNLILQILLLPVYLLVFMGKTPSIGLQIDLKTIALSVMVVLVFPLTVANVAKRLVKKTNGEPGLAACRACRFPLHFGMQKPRFMGCCEPSVQWSLQGKKVPMALSASGTFEILRAKRNKLLAKITARNDDIQFCLLCLAITAMFASQGSVLLANVMVFTKLLLPLLLFFVVNFLLSLFVGKKLALPFYDIIPLVFTTSARNSPVSLAIAVLTFPAEPVISLVLVMGPLIELPVLAFEAAILKKAHKVPGKVSCLSAP